MGLYHSRMRHRVINQNLMKWLIYMIIFLFSERRHTSTSVRGQAKSLHIYISQSGCAYKCTRCGMYINPFLHECSCQAPPTMNDYINKLYVGT